MECLFYSLCSSFKEFHQRGTLPQCTNSSSDVRTSEVLKRVKYIASNKSNSQWSNNSIKPNRRPNFKPNQPCNLRKIKRIHNNLVLITLGTIIHHNFITESISPTTESTNVLCNKFPNH